MSLGQVSLKVSTSNNNAFNNHMTNQMTNHMTFVYFISTFIYVHTFQYKYTILNLITYQNYNKIPLLYTNKKQSCCTRKINE